MVDERRQRSAEEGLAAALHHKEAARQRSHHHNRHHEEALEEGRIVIEHEDNARVPPMPRRTVQMIHKSILLLVRHNLNRIRIGVRVHHATQEKRSRRCHNRQIREYVIEIGRAYVVDRVGEEFVARHGAHEVVRPAERLRRVEEHARGYNVRAPQILEFLCAFDVNVDVEATVLVQYEISTHRTKTHKR